MAERSVVGIYDTMAQAEEAVHKLDHEGFPVKHISIVTQNLASDRRYMAILCLVTIWPYVVQRLEPGWEAC